MSSKHIKALGLGPSNLSSLKQVDSDEDEGEEDDICVAKSAFLALDESSSCSDSDSSDSGDEHSSENEVDNIPAEEVEESNGNAHSCQEDQKAATLDDDADMIYLNSLLDSASTDPNETIYSKQYHFLQSERHTLDIDAVMRRRFGGSSLHAGDDGEDEGNRDHNRKKTNNKQARNRRIIANQMKKSGTFSNKRLLFGAPKEEWPRPLSFINGGICMQQVSHEERKGSSTSDESDICSSHSTESTQASSNAISFKNGNEFEILWSPDYHHLQAEFLRVQSSGDANQLCLFISHHPHHSEALLQLAMIFARTGQMDRATDLVRRCLYYLEQTHIESFKPYEYPCFVDINRQENKVYFLALFRHMQISGMLGCPKVASSIGKFILSLDTANDPVHALLFLDYYFLTSGNHSEIEEFCSISAGKVLLQTCFYNGEESSKAASSNDSIKCDLSPYPTTLNELYPNWAFSFSLSHHYQEVKLGIKNLKPQSTHILSPTITSLSLSQELFIQACRRFPCMISMSLATAMRDDKMRRNWKVIQEHPFFVAFSSAERLTEQVGSENSKLLQVLCKFHRLKSVDCGNSSVWKQDDVLGWMYDTLQCFLEGLSCDGDFLKESINQSANFLIAICSGLQATQNTHEKENYDATTTTEPATLNNPLLFRYLKANEEDFLEEYPRLPPEANPLDPRFTDPRVLAGEYRPDMGGGLFGFGGNEQNDLGFWEMQDFMEE